MRLFSGSIPCVGLTVFSGAFAQVAVSLSDADYERAVSCAGKFRWVLDASSGGQPALNEYTLDERVKGGEVWTTRAEELADGLDPSTVVAADIQSVADETIGAFFDDPDTVEAELLQCAIGMGMREE